MMVYHAGGGHTKCDDMFSRFDTIRVCNGRTDGHLAMRQHGPQYAYASRGKNGPKIISRDLS